MKLNKNEKKIYRHGEIGFVVIDEIPKNLKEEKTDLIMLGSGNNPHTFKGGKIYFKNNGNFIFGYFMAKNTKLYHKEHGNKQIGNLKEAKLPDGNYKLLKQVEFINKEMKQIID